ncbi:hypothetical protein [Pseudonocardia sp. ICBG601]|uniref:hypothetical protein n=1 Tax=Pseudonocardia sp. ICBG601 TaxID=2846759 RepID=UPI001CF644A8|nr:hypothetical protein [Pseudonocardia sp. ICBG601]
MPTIVTGTLAAIATLGLVLTSSASADRADLDATLDDAVAVAHLIETACNRVISTEIRPCACMRT